MAMARSLQLFAAIGIFLQTSQAIPWIGAMETPLGIMATAGMSPRPTEAPGLNGIPKELMRRADVQYPPPDNWCGFVDGLYDNPLSCSSQLTCINSGTAVGCCSGLDNSCDGLYTSCAGYADTCDNTCKQDPNVAKCGDPNFPYCGTFSFFGGTYLYNCQSTIQILPDSVEYLADYYITAIGSTLAPTSDPFSLAKGTGTRAAATESGSSGPKSTSSRSSTSSNNDDDANTGLAAAAIGGIAAGAGLVIIAILGFVIWFCLRRRKRSRLAASQNMAHHAPPTFNPDPQMQQQQQQQAGGYQTVPQQDHTQFQGNNQYQPTQSGYFGGPTPEPGKNNNSAFTHVSPLASPSLSTTEPPARPFSTASSQHPGEQQQKLSPPVAGYAGPLAGGVTHDFYKQPASPNVMEVDGTQGNPGVPYGSQQNFNEVDGTQGNPGVPYNRQHYQGPYEMH